MLNRITATFTVVNLILSQFIENCQPPESISSGDGHSEPGSVRQQSVCRVRMRRPGNRSCVERWHRTVLGRMAIFCRMISEPQSGLIRVALRRTSPECAKAIHYQQAITLDHNLATHQLQLIIVANTRSPSQLQIGPPSSISFNEETCRNSTKPLKSFRSRFIYVKPIADRT